MKQLEKNIINLFEQQGRNWLDALPSITKALSQQWALTHIIPVSNMSWNFVATAIQQGTYPVVLKISCDKKLIDEEIKALRYFKGHGCIKLIDVNFEQNALLLEQATPGNSLKSLYPQQLELVINHYAKVIEQLTSIGQDCKKDFRHVQDWLSAIDRMPESAIPIYLLNKAIALKNHLLDTASDEYVLHGDLHHDNILNHHSQWLAIDPKGIVGEIAFEAAAFDFITQAEFETKNNLPNLLQKRISLLANKLKLNPMCLMMWVFVRLILSAAWFIEDNGDPRWSIAMGDYVYQILPHA